MHPADKLGRSRSPKMLSIPLVYMFTSNRTEECIVISSSSDDEAGDQVLSCKYVSMHVYTRMCIYRRELKMAVNIPHCVTNIRAIFSKTLNTQFTRSNSALR